jgi:membrane protein EpsK
VFAGEYRLTRSLSANVLASSVGAVINALCGLATAAFLLRQLGMEAFGTWALVVSTTSLLWLLDLGTTTAVGRLIAARRARDDIEGVNRIFSTAIGMLLICAIGVVFVSLFIPGAFLALFSVPPQDTADVILALWLMALASAVHFIAAPFTCLLWGYERLDLTNLIDAPLVVLRLGLVFVFVGTNSPIWIIGACTLAAGCLGALMHAFTSFLVEPKLAPRPHLATRSSAVMVFRLGFDFAALNATRSLALQLSPIIIGHTLGNAAVGVFAIARQLTVNCNILVSATTEAVAARSVRLFHEEAHAGQQGLFIEGGRYTTALSCLLAVGLFVFGDTFVHLWQGGRADEAYPHLVILMAGELIALSQWVTYWVIGGVRRQRTLSLFALAESLTIVSLGYLLVQPFGLAGVSFATAAGASFFRGIGPLVYGCRILAVAHRDYIARVVLPNVLCSVVAGLGAYGIDAWLDPRDWSTLILAGFLYVGIFAASLILFVFPSIPSLKPKPPP